MFKLKSSIVFSALLLILLGGCFDPPDDFVAPTWDTKINIPVTSQNFSLMELIEKDSTIFRASDDPKNMGLIYVGDTQKVSTVTVAEQLKISGFHASTTQKIGALKITAPPPVTAAITMSNLGISSASGQTAPFPEFSQTIDIPIEGVATVQSAKMESGNLKLSITNSLPVEIQLKGINLVNTNDNSVVAQRLAPDVVTISPLEEETVNFDLTNKTITNSLKYIGEIYSPGSGTTFVEIPSNDVITLNAAFENLVISEVTAQLPTQKFNFNKTFALTDSTKITEASIISGRAEITINNNMDIELNASIVFENLVNSTGESYKLDIHVERNEQNKVISLDDLPAWKVVSKTSEPTDSLKYSVSVFSDSTGQASTITKDDEIGFAISFSDLTFKSFTGLLKPLKIKLNKEGFGIDYGHIMDNLEIGEVVFKDCKFKINFNSTAKVPVFVSGNLYATNGITSNTMHINEIDISESGPNYIDVTELINGFSNELPDSFAIEGEAKINPNYEIVSVSGNDSIYGDVEFEIPLNIGIPQGTFKDTFNIDIGNINEEKIDNFNYGEINIEIENRLPIGVTVTATIIDSLNRPILDLPTDYNEIDCLEIPKPEVNLEGEVISSSKLTQSLVVKGEDIKKFLKNPNMIVNIAFSTAGNNGAPVKFKTSNNIIMKVRANAEYKVDLQ
ncbi:MAG: hypothetical protein CR986_00830 [Ignavibacteriae bacterium]|nr:MAG: hypothetical protein CR986_00830 [Ignavibacteriota bacterium]